MTSSNGLVLTGAGITLTILSLLNLAPMYTISIYAIVLIAIVAVFIIKYQEELTFSRIMLLLLSCLAFSFYVYFRMHMPYMKYKSIIKFGQNIMISSGMIFSLVYGSCQIFGGIAMQYFPTLTAIGSYIGSGLTLLAIAFSNNSILTKILFGLLGLFSIGINLNTNECPNKNFNSDWFATLSLYGVSFGFMLASGILVPATLLFSWNSLYIILAAILIAVGIIYFVYNKITCTPKCTISNENHTAQSQTTAMIENPLTKTQIGLMFLFCTIVVMPYYALQNGLLSIVARDTQISGELSGIICLLMPLLDGLNDKILLYGSTIIGIIGLLLMLFTTNTILLQISVACLSVIAMAHNFPFVMVGKRMKNAGAIFGFLNFGAMFLGCFGSQFLFANYLNGFTIKTIAAIFLPIFTGALSLIYFI